MATICTVVLVMAFSLFGHNLLHIGHGDLAAPSDLWSLASSSSAMLHGHFDHVYLPSSALTSPPALEVLLVPVMAFGQVVGLSPHLHQSGLPLSMWLVLGPAAVGLASMVLFALDAVARSWRLSVRSRFALALVGGLGVANVVAGWGHPEDCIALAFVVWSALTVEQKGSAGAPRAALLLGIGIAFQPLAVLGVVPVLARLPWRRAALLWWRLLLPSAIVLAAPLLAEPHETLFVLVHQPFKPKWISLTPLTHLAPVLAPGVNGGGPTRLVALLLSAALALFVCRRRHDLPTVLTMISVAFLLRILLETELNWYYLWPLPALCLVLSLRRSWPRFWLCTAAMTASAVIGAGREHHIAVWWPTLMALALLMLLSATPSPRRWLAGDDVARSDLGPEQPVEFGSMVNATKPG